MFFFLFFQTCVSKHDDSVRPVPPKVPVSTDKKRDPSATQPQVSEGSSGATVAAVIISVLVVLVVVGAGFFIVTRTRLAPRLRARLMNTPYGDMVSGRPPTRSDSQQNVIA